MLGGAATIPLLALPERRGGSLALIEVIARWTDYQVFRDSRSGGAELGRMGLAAPVPLHVNSRSVPGWAARHGY